VVSGIFLSETDEGAETVTASCLIKLEVSNKKVSNKNATSVIAVISTHVLLRCNFTFGIYLNIKTVMINV